MQIQTLNDLFESQLQSLYDIEAQLIQNLPYFSEKAQSPDLKQALSQHIDVTKKQLRRLEEIADNYDLSLTGVPDTAMANLIRENQDIISQISDPVLLDTAILSGAGKIEHYEMAAYQATAEIARKLGKSDAAEMLNHTLSEEMYSARFIENAQNSGVSSKEES